MDKRNLVIAGTGLFAELARVYFEEYTDYEVLAFSCHRAYMNKDSLNGLPVIAIEDIAKNFASEENDVFVAIGYSKMNKVRQRVYEELKVQGYTFPSFVHPNVKTWDTTAIGENVFIFEDNTIQPFTRIGNNTILWSGNHIGHHSIIGDHCFISSHVVISGSCRIGNNVFIGVNATLRDSLNVADETLIGAGALIMKDTQEKDVYVPQATKRFSKNSEDIGF
ncbi:MAG: acetyltransferase [Alphaproteobacteria bacterium]